MGANLASAELPPLRPDDHVRGTGLEAIVYLASDRSAHVTGTVLSVDGGMSVGVPPRT